MSTGNFIKGNSGGSIGTTETIAFNNNLNSGDQDTNDIAFTYKWANTNTPEGLTLSSNGEMLTVTTAGMYHINPYLEVTNATASDRALFVLQCEILNSDNSVKMLLHGPAAYVRGNLFSDVTASGCDFTATLAVGEQFRIKTKRLFSEDPTDDNPANQNLSTLLVRRINFGLE